MKRKFEEYMKIASDPNRANSKDYINYIFSNFIEMHGDRLYGDDLSITTGIGLLDDIPVTILGQNRGKDISEQIKYNYSMSHPEGYRKALRATKQAEKFARPIICFIDTLGAYPGQAAEERGQHNAIATNLMKMMYTKVPIISIIIGSGGSGGALAFCVADKVIMLEYATFGVISPRSCANILWKDPEREIEAAKLLKITSNNLKKFGFVDKIISEKKGEYNFEDTAKKIKSEIKRSLVLYKKVPINILLKHRYNKYMSF
ncbi:MAG: acetyl-CoA carboxylase carboxyl transferase subunit alpha [Clostridia bacterium]|nr:acetyl-CoA carboxylase carboxyl transferase subunit alpha [Clostridia bacterium]